MVFCIYPKLGTTYFCQHNLNAIEIDSSILAAHGLVRYLPALVRDYMRAGYTYIFVEFAQPDVLEYMKQSKIDFKIVAPERTQNDMLDIKLFCCNNVIRVKPGEHLSSVLK